MTDHEALVAALATPAVYPHAPASVEHVQTHISHVFLAGPFVYKLKKPVRLPFVDQSTPARRRALCDAEIRLNRRLAPDVYLAVVPIVRGGGGRIVVGGTGRPVDHLVWMRRLPADRMLVRLLAEGRVEPEILVRLARRLADFHAGAATGPSIARHAAPGALRRTWTRTLALTAPLVGHGVPAGAVDVLARFGPAFVDRHRDLLRARMVSGRIRDGHGDLHAEHVCVVDRPIPAPPPLAPLAPGLQVFDCLEFSAALRAVDVASEIAFLAMDLERRGHPALARAFVDAYVDASGDEALRPLLPWYVAYRACVRAGVAAITTTEAEVDPAERAAAATRAAAYVALALRHAWSSDGPALIAVCGRSGTGKTTVATALADALGAVHVSSDVLRRAAQPDAAAAPPGRGAYTPDARTRIYARLTDEAAAHLRAGRSVIADATFLRAADRERLAAVARSAGCPLVFLECRTAPDDVRERLAARPPGPSDATWEIWQAQARDAEPFAAAEPHRLLDTGGPALRVHDEALRAAWTALRQR